MEPGKAILGSQDGESPVDADSVILCVGYRAEKSLYEACKNKLPEAAHWRRKQCEQYYVRHLGRLRGGKHTIKGEVEYGKHS